ncbi:Meiotically up-regulated like protein-like protein [Emericellopsis cladophorae]|uniref:Meiotically up-regulated like protein-like protein n=1 Tax=Emericellopsis cladophorae TaxID=2686198 RepID=A0A9Q0BHD6_9HYPO|nr:Meiotically up-regulated like protein-like protein [Emericellopsis cladophorae]KAI6785957.1 Meiotically up-regulated like protein-like protein [Emericellopsis cladophorae]
MPGGVCAVLDYDVEVMAEYVADMAIRVVTPEATVTPGFRKFVSQVLTSTRLPSTTILLGMNYLAKRINSMKTQGAYTATEGQVWRYLTVSLLLGSKFLDDNTFQNRSWSEVSGISVSELNALEFDWVQSMSWRLYVNLDLSKDYQAWLENWKEWQHTKKRQLQASRERATPRIPAINTEVGRYHDARHSSYSRYLKDQAAEVDRYQAGKVHQHGSYHSRESAWSSNPWSAPLTPPDSGYGTPESYGMSAVSSNAHYNDWFSQAAAQYNNGRFHQASARNPFYSSRPPAYSAHGYTYNQHQNIWEHGMAECNCPSCASPLKEGPYFTSHGYGQPVMG